MQMQKSTYESQAEKWKNTKFPKTSTTTIDREVTFLNELCSEKVVSSFPPRELLNKFLKASKSLDQEYICELLEAKFVLKNWQVKAKALAVLESLLKLPNNEYYLSYFSEDIERFDKFCNDSRDAINSRAVKITVILNDYLKKLPPSSDKEVVSAGEKEVSLLPLRQESQPSGDLYIDNQQNLKSTPETISNNLAMPNIVSPLLSSTPMSHESLLMQNSNSNAYIVPSSVPTTLSPSITASSFYMPSPAVLIPIPVPDSSLQLLTSLNVPYPVPVASAVPVNDYTINPVPFLAPQLDQTESKTAFNFIQENQMSKVNQEELVVMQEEVKHVENKEELKDNQNEIYDAFEGLALNETSKVPLGSTPVMPIAQGLSIEGKPCEVLVEVDVPPGPLGIILDKTISNMAVIEKFTLLPNGETGILALHPVLCPGCKIVAINNQNLEEFDLNQVGFYLGVTYTQQRTITFKKIMIGGITANPNTLEAPYLPPLKLDEQGKDEHEESDNKLKIDQEHNENEEQTMENLERVDDDINSSLDVDEVKEEQSEEDLVTHELNLIQEEIETIEKASGQYELALLSTRSSIQEKEEAVFYLSDFIRRLKEYELRDYKDSTISNTELFEERKQTIRQLIDTLIHRFSRTLILYNTPTTKQPSFSLDSDSKTSAFSFLTHDIVSSPKEKSSAFSFLSGDSPVKASNNSAFSFLSSDAAQQLDKANIDSSALNSPSANASAFSFLKTDEDKSTNLSPKSSPISSPKSSAFGFL